MNPHITITYDDSKILGFGPSAIESYAEATTNLPGDGTQTINIKTIPCTPTCYAYLERAGKDSAHAITVEQNHFGAELARLK